MYGLGGMWVISLVLVLPLLIGIGSTSKRVYEFLRARGVSRNNALTASVVGLIMLAGVMSSPLFLGAMPLRLLAGASYLYFLYVGGRSIVNYFTGGGSGAKGEDQSQGDDDCGCDHDGHAKRAEHGDADAPARVEPTEPEPKRPTPPPAPPKRTAAELRAELDRRIAEGDKKD